MANQAFESQWYNEDDLDYRTPGREASDGGSTSPAQQNQPQRGRPDPSTPAVALIKLTVSTYLRSKREGKRWR
jgi:hypothetical protein